MSKKLGCCILLSIFALLILQISIKKKPDDYVKTIITNKKNTIVAINYPQTKYKHLNQKIQKYINDVYDDFKDEYDFFLNLKGKSELNIDYTYYITKEGYISIVLYTYIDSSLLESPLREIKTFAYDSKKKRDLSLLDITKNKENLKQKILDTLKLKYKDETYKSLITNSYLKKIPYSISKDKVSLYIPSYQNKVTPYLIHLPLSDFNLNEKEENKHVFDYTPKSKVIDPKQKVLALTFDDGPSKYTDKIINLLKKYDITATFFVLGNKVSLYEDTLKKMLKEGHEIGNHSYNHKLMSTLSEDEIKEQIQKTQDIIYEKLGYKVNSLRPTYGSVNTKIKQSTNMNIVLWSVDTLDWKLKDPKKIAERGLKVKDEDIILMHDSKSRTEKALSIMIPKLLEENYQFVTISELEEVKLLRKKLQ